MYDKLLWIEKFGLIVSCVVLNILAFIALSEQTITLGSPKSPLTTYSSGFNAVWIGFLLIAGALACIGYLLKYTAFYRLYWVVAFISWLTFIIWYMLTQNIN